MPGNVLIRNTAGGTKTDYLADNNLKYRAPKKGRLKILEFNGHVRAQRLYSFSNFNIAANQEIKILIQMKAIVLTLVIGLGMMNINAQETRSADEASGLPVGTEAPSFKAIDADGKQFELASALKNGRNDFLQGTLVSGVQQASRGDSGQSAVDHGSGSNGDCRFPTES
jgi:hypothetical protein